tara:strand:- start:994 stop:1569 length:576 start_codon:yes stop_codon:yes gene_type:complete
MKNKKLIIYVHGWNSHEKARKAVLIAEELKLNINYEVSSLTLHHHPREAINQLSEIIKTEKKNREVFLIGSSLGGYFSVYLSEKYNLKAAMINPAVWAYKIFKNNMGKNINGNTGIEYIVDNEWVNSLEEIFIKKITHKNYLVLLQTGDETLNYKFAEKYFKGSKIEIDKGGNHSFENLESKIPIILEHFS